MDRSFCSFGSVLMLYSCAAITVPDCLREASSAVLGTGTAPFMEHCLPSAFDAHSPLFWLRISL